MIPMNSNYNAVSVQHFDEEANNASTLSIADPKVPAREPKAFQLLESGLFSRCRHCLGL